MLVSGYCTGWYLALPRDEHTSKVTLEHSVQEMARSCVVEAFDC